MSSEFVSCRNVNGNIRENIQQAKRKIGVAIGGFILDLNAIAHFYPAQVQESLRSETLNLLMSLGYDAWKIVRGTTQNLLQVGSQLDRDEKLKKS